MSFFSSIKGAFSMPHVLPVAMAEEAVENVEDVEEAPVVPSPPAPKAKAKPVTLDSLSPEEIESLKEEIVSEVVDKIPVEDFIQSETHTAPYDPRFPNRNQARHCFVRFNEYHKCVFERGEDHERCQFYQKAYLSLCPNDWLESWTELREKGLWTGKY